MEEDLGFTAELKDAQRKYVERLVARCQELVGEAEVVRTAFTAKKGIGSSSAMMLSWFTQPLLVFQSFRVVAVTDQRVYVFKSGWFTRYKPKELRHTLNRPGAIELLDRGRFQIGSERLRPDPAYLMRVVAAVAGTAPTPPPADRPPVPPPPPPPRS